MVLYRFKPVESWTRMQEATISGHAYMIGHRFESVDAGDSAEILFEVPENTNRDIYIIDISIATLSECYLDIFIDSTVVSSGTKLTPFNLNTNYESDTTVNIEYGGTYSDGQLIYSSVIPGGFRVNALGYVVTAGAGIILNGGKKLHIKITNISTTASTDVSVNLLWIEESG